MQNKVGDTEPTTPKAIELMGIVQKHIDSFNLSEEALEEAARAIEQQLETQSMTYTEIYAAFRGRFEERWPELSDFRRDVLIIFGYCKLVLTGRITAICFLEECRPLEEGEVNERFWMAASARRKELVQ